MTETNQASLTKHQRVMLVAILLGGSFMAILNQTLLLTATPHIMTEFRLTENSAQWVTTIFLLINGILIPISAFLMEKFTTRSLYITTMAIFLIGTIICAFAYDFTLLMVGRVVQAIGAGIIYPLMMTVFMLIYPLKRRGFAMGIAGLVISFAPAIGPALTGWMIEFLPWRSVFYIIIPIAMLDVIAAYFFMRNIIPQTNPQVDVLSIILSTFGFGGLLYGFSSAGNDGFTHPAVLSALIIGGIALTLFILRQLSLVQPILEVRVFKYRIFAICSVIGMIIFTVLIAAETILPIYMQVMAGFTAFEAGIVILPGALLTGLLSPIVGRIFDAIGGRWLLIIGLFITSVTTLLFVDLTPETSLLYLTVAFAVRMFGMSMVMMPSTTTGLNVLPNRLMPHGTAVMNTTRQVAASIGTGLLITIMTIAAKDPHMYGVQGLIHGVNVSFYVMAAITAIAFVLALFVRDKKHTNTEM